MPIELTDDQRDRKLREVSRHAKEMQSRPHLSPFARTELGRRYPGQDTSQAINQALERLRTLEQILKIPSNPSLEDSENV